jgi:hypothetical protein
VRQHEGVVVGRQQRVHRHRHHAGVQRAEEGDRPVGGVVHQQQHALLAAQAGCEQGGGAAARALLELRVADAAGVVDVGVLAAAPGIQREEVAREVEALGRRRRPSGPFGHGMSPSCPVLAGCSVRRFCAGAVHDPRAASGFPAAD